MRNESLGFGRVVSFWSKDWEEPSVFFAFSAFSLGVSDFVEIKELFRLYICYIGWYSFHSKTFGLHFTGLEGFRETKPSAAFVLLSFCSIMTSCTEPLIITKSPFGSSLILEILRLGWYCLNSLISVLQFLNFPSTPLSITGIEFFVLGLGRTGVPRGTGTWLGSVVELLALRFLRPRVTSVNPSP